MKLVNPFDNLPDELIIKIGVLQAIKEICNFSLINVRFSKLINNQFWSFKFLNDFGSHDINEVRPPRIKIKCF